MEHPKPSPDQSHGLWSIDPASTTLLTVPATPAEVTARPSATAEAQTRSSNAENVFSSRPSRVNSSLQSKGQSISSSETEMKTQTRPPKPNISAGRKPAAGVFPHSPNFCNDVSNADACSSSPLHGLDQGPADTGYTNFDRQGGPEFDQLDPSTDTEGGALQQTASASPPADQTNTLQLFAPAPTQAPSMLEFNMGDSTVTLSAPTTTLPNPFTTWNVITSGTSSSTVVFAVDTSLHSILSAETPSSLTAIDKTLKEGDTPLTTPSPSGTTSTTVTLVAPTTTDSAASQSSMAMESDGTTLTTVTLVSDTHNTSIDSAVTPFPTMLASDSVTPVTSSGSPDQSSATGTDATSVSTTSAAAAATAANVTSLAPEKSSWNATKVIAPTVTVCILLAALVLWLLMRREKRKRRVKEVERKAQWFKSDIGEIIRRRMMEVDRSKTDPFMDQGESERSAEGGSRANIGVGANFDAEGMNARDPSKATEREGLDKVRDRQEKSLSISMIERDLDSRDGSRKDSDAVSGGPVSSLGEPVRWDVEVIPHVPRDEANLSTRGNGSASLTAMPSPRSEQVTLVDRARAADGGCGWRVFRGCSEIKSYEAKKDGAEGRRGALGKMFGRWL